MEGNYCPNKVPNILYTDETKFEFKKGIVLMPPPNVTANRLHLGHALNIVIQDAWLRWNITNHIKYEWIPGFDHAGIATQSVMQKKYSGKIDEIKIATEKFANENRLNMRKQIDSLSTIQDWNREYYTLDPGHSQKVRNAFIKLYNMGLIYRKNKLVNWSLKLQTTISDIEVEKTDLPKKVYFIKFPIVDRPNVSISVGTTQPETCLGDVAIVVHADDPRYIDLKNCFVWHPIKLENIPIIHEKKQVDINKFTGALKITPAHDTIDWSIAERNGLKYAQVFDEKERVMLTGEFCGLSASKCRELVLVKLKDLGLLLEEREILAPALRCTRSGGRILILPREQWFIKSQKMATLARDAVKLGKIQLVPSQEEAIWYQWLNNIEDWCISRQLWWGHPIPAYQTASGEWLVADNIESAQTQAGCNVVQDTDVLDTWFSSALLPQTVIERSSRYSDTIISPILFTGKDIIFFWVARMVMLSMIINNIIPFEKVVFHDLIRDENGKKMSKSHGNGIDPLELINEFGVDSVRFSLLYYKGKYDKKECKRWRQWCNKIWHSCKYVQQYSGGSGGDSRDMEMMQRLDTLKNDISKMMQRFDFHSICERIWMFWQYEFCCDYLEYSKSHSGCQNTLRSITDQFLILLTPYMPNLANHLRFNMHEKAK